ncbi:MAG: Benzoate 1,2-dioxygenase electron transfer component [Candidatus Dichloromethanomonas elyunquensis]|nr:MAG: Benzoate 1,2-dioxygenase electron transfer component [Candidatus Dichloromethanomonas elyunquensis]
MRKYPGPLYILITILITVIFWSISEPLQSISLNRQYSQLIAAVMMTCFAWVFFLSTRHPLTDRLFQGLDKSYVCHKFLSIVNVLLIVVHKELLDSGKRNLFRQPGGITGQIYNLPAGSPHGAGHGMFTGMASLSMALFIIFTLFAVFAWKLHYEKWKIIHQLFIIPYLIGTIHYYGSSDYAVTGFQAFGLWLNIVNLTGLASAIYSILIYEKTAFPYRYTITSIRPIAKDTLEVTGSTVKKGIFYQAGQFAFLKLPDKKNKFPSHPFTISQACRKGEVQFAIKALGGHTASLLRSVKEGDSFAVSGPHGRFNYLTGTKRQLWIAGGIGITPFRSFYQTAIPKDFEIDLFYCYNNPQEAPYLEELQDLEKKTGIKIHLVPHHEKGFLSMEYIENVLDNKEPLDIYFCGPAAMRKKLRKEMKKSRLRINNLYYEHFQFK